MKLLNTKSLAATVDSVNDAMFFGRAIPAAEKLKVSKWLALRQGVKHSYSGLPAPTDIDLGGIKLFTGEAMLTGGRAESRSCSWVYIGPPRARPQG